jgi:15-cis-phytoene synthase
VSGRELTAAAITDPRMRSAYTACRRLNATHGRTYYLATLLLPRSKRPFVHALYGFARYADDIVDQLDPARPAGERAARFERWSTRVQADLANGDSADPICAALIDTARRWDIPVSYFDEFLDSMRMDLTVTAYETAADLHRYMRGSAAVIGLQMVPILGCAHDGVDIDEMAARAGDLGIAFQLTNFLRDVGEDLRRGRIYLPQESLRRHDVDRDRLQRGVARGGADRAIRALIADEIARTRLVYERAVPGIDLVHPSSQPCLRTAVALYSGILDEIERAGYDVLSRRASVGMGRRGWVAGRGLVAAWAARRPSQTQPVNVSSTRQKPNSRSSTGA